MTTSGARQGIRPGVCLSTSRPASPFIGQIIYMTDVNQSAVWNGTSWEGLDRSRDRNVVINGNMDVWQRGTTFSISTGVAQYTADRWQQYFNGSGTIAQETTVKPDTSLFSLKMTATATSGDNRIFQLVEHRNMAKFKGKTVTLSVKLAGTATISPSIALAYSTNADDSLTNTGTAITASSTTTPAINASTFVTWVSTFTVPITAKTLRIGIGTGPVVNTNVLYVSEVQLEAGTVATPFEFEDYGTTLQKCQRYFQAYPSSRYDLYSQRSGDEVKSATLQFITTLRTTPTVTLVNTSTDGGPAFTVQAFPHCSRVSVTSTSSAQAPYIDSWTATAEL